MCPAPIDIKKYPCPRCGKEFELPTTAAFLGRDGKQGHLCKTCFGEVRFLNEKIAELAKKINATTDAATRAKLLTQVRAYEAFLKKPGIPF
jgi:DNA-directed RNA polymerase subunit RPC12/RpoP